MLINKSAINKTAINASASGGIAYPAQLCVTLNQSVGRLTTALTLLTLTQNVVFHSTFTTNTVIILNQQVINKELEQIVITLRQRVYDE